MVKVPQTEISRQGLSAALKIRSRVGVDKKDPVCAFDLAAKLGIEVRFVSGNSFGGMFSRTSNVILIPSQRPPGRRAMTCAHEIGHWFFRHGSRIDPLDSEAIHRLPFEDRLSNALAQGLLMPPWAVRNEFHVRSLDPRTCGPIGIYRVANQLGVAYEALVRQLQQTLGMINRASAKSLLNIAPAQIRAEILGSEDSRHLVIVDTAWHAIPVDLEVGDFIIVPAGTLLGSTHLGTVGAGQYGSILQALSPGISDATILSKNWAVFIRVSRREFTGLSMYRHLEEA